MGSVFALFMIFTLKVVNNALGTAKTIFIQRSRWIPAGLAVVLSDFIYFWLTRRIVTSDGWVSLAVVSIAGGVGCALACLIGDRISRDRTYVIVVMCDDKSAMRQFRDFLAEHHITNVCCDSYTRDWDRKTLTVTAYTETKAERGLIDGYLENSPLKFKKVIQKR